MLRKTLALLLYTHTVGQGQGASEEGWFWEDAVSSDGHTSFEGYVGHQTGNVE